MQVTCVLSGNRVKEEAGSKGTRRQRSKEVESFDLLVDCSTAHYPLPFPLQ
jgi:hypothetical protein